MDETKVCNGCKLEKPRSSYRKGMRQCLDCLRIKDRVYWKTQAAKDKRAQRYKKNRIKILANQRLWYYANWKEIRKRRKVRSKKLYQRDREKILKRLKAYRDKYPEARRSTKHLNMYGITVEVWEGMYREQGGVCRICGGVNPDGRRLFVDHDHRTGVVRGLLCHCCNFGIGYLKHNETILLNAIRYLKSNANIQPIKKEKRVGVILCEPS